MFAGVERRILSIVLSTRIVGNQPFSVCVLPVVVLYTMIYSENRHNSEQQPKIDQFVYPGIRQMSKSVRISEEFHEFVTRNLGIANSRR
jgi:hypothetical protein